MTTVIFIGLLIDLLAFTLILPLLPALLEHYRQHDRGGLYPWLEARVKSFQAVLGSPDQGGTEQSREINAFKKVSFRGHIIYFV